MKFDKVQLSLGQSAAEIEAKLWETPAVKTPIEQLKEIVKTEKVEVTEAKNNVMEKVQKSKAKIEKTPE